MALIKDLFTGGKNILNPLGQNIEQTFDPKQPFESAEDFLAPGFGDNLRRLTETPSPTGVAETLDPRSEEALGRLAPTPSTFSDRRDVLRERFEAGGRSSAAAASSATRLANVEQLNRLRSSRSIQSSLQALINRLERQSKGIDVTTSGEAFLSGFFG